MVVAEVEVIHVRRWIDAAQRAVERYRRRAERQRGPLRHLDLHELARHDVVLRTAHRLEELPLVHRALERPGQRRLGGRLGEHQRLGQRACEAMAQRLEPLVGFAQCARLARIGVHHEIQLAKHVIDHGELVRNEQQYVRRAERIGLIALERARLDVPDRFIAEVADQAAAEAKRCRQRRRALAPEPRARIVEGIVVALFQADVGAARVAQQPPHAPAARLDALGAGEADERVAAETLAAHHGLEKVAVRAAGKLHVHGERRIEIGARLGEHGNARIAKRREPVELCLIHELLPAGLRKTTGGWV